ncbi:MAG: type II secretion system protein [Pseudomonadota bacterium]|uniref:type IV pilus modification PilV family protein n=1 Tax=Gallaecimonas pentaromativorans TaxID=584787 RepID=UPI00067E6AE5|nr:type II secretion system protein [Gallaecimonas pentaromativorans]MED5526792.1 type II secretion system protein [Pseudomonadota bacterium]
MKANGFTLLEVLVAFVVLAMVLGGLLRVLSQSGRLEGSAANRQQAMAMAQSQLALLLSRKALPSSEERGKFDNGWRWQAKVSPFEGAEGNWLGASNRAIEVRLTVSWGEYQQLMLTTLAIEGAL